MSDSILPLHCQADGHLRVVGDTPARTLHELQFVLLHQLLQQLFVRGSGEDALRQTCSQLGARCGASSMLSQHPGGFS